MPWAGLLLALLILPAGGSAANADTSGASTSDFPSDSTTVVSETFGSTGAMQWHHPPDGVTSINLVAVGGWGASLSGRAGGRPAEVAARIAVEPLGSLYLMVAGNGKGGVTGEGGFNGGGSGANAGWATAAGGGGGGASDARTIPEGWEDTLESRLLIAAGGGGAGSTSNFGDRGGGPGGDAATAGKRGDNGTPQNGAGSGGFGGEAGTETAAGAGGIGGYIYGSGGSSGNGEDGDDGALGDGGAGGLGVENTGTGMGGGGGGGIYGGGGGGGGIHLSFPPDVYVSGGGGGGGGSSLVPAGGTLSLAEDGEQPSITVNYTIPGTRILAGPAARVSTGNVRFDFESTEAGSTLECSLDQVDSFETCDATVEFENLAPGVHTFRARSVNSMGNFDPTPAIWVFEVAPGGPPAVIDPGAGAGGDPKGGDPGADGRVDRGGPSGKPNKASQAWIKIGKPRLNRRRGLAVVAVRVSAAGKLRLLGNKRVRPVVARSSRAATIRLKVRPRPRFKRLLNRRGQLSLRLNVHFKATAGGKATKSFGLKLRRAKR